MCVEPGAPSEMGAPGLLTFHLGNNTTIKKGNKTITPFTCEFKSVKPGNTAFLHCKSRQSCLVVMSPRTFDTSVAKKHLSNGIYTQFLVQIRIMCIA